MQVPDDDDHDDPRNRRKRVAAAAAAQAEEEKRRMDECEAIVLFSCFDYFGCFCFILLTHGR